MGWRWSDRLGNQSIRDAAMTDSEPERPLPWWRRPIHVRLSVRGLMVVVLLVGGLPGWYINSAHVQRDAVKAIMREGGAVHYDISHPDFPGPPRRRSIWPRELVVLLGPDYFGNVTYVDLPQGATDDVMAHIGRLRRVETLRILSGNRLTNTGMAHLRRLTALTSLEINDAPIDGVGFKNLQGLTRLKSLALRGARLVDADLAVVKNMRALEVLTLRG